MNTISAPSSSELEHVGLTKMLVETRSDTVPGQREIMEKIEEELRGSDCRLMRMPVADTGMFNLVAVKGNGPKKVLISGHVDTYQLPKDARCNFVRDETNMYGPGVGDMKKGIASMIYAARNYPVTAGMTVVFAFLVDEEGESLGALEFLRHMKASNAVDSDGAPGPANLDIQPGRGPLRIPTSFDVGFSPEIPTNARKLARRETPIIHGRDGHAMVHIRMDQLIDKLDAEAMEGGIDLEDLQAKLKGEARRVGSGLNPERLNEQAYISDALITRTGFSTSPDPLTTSDLSLMREGQAVWRHELGGKMGIDDIIRFYEKQYREWNDLSVGVRGGKMQSHYKAYVRMMSLSGSHALFGVKFRGASGHGSLRSPEVMTSRGIFDIEDAYQKFKFQTRARLSDILRLRPDAPDHPLTTVSGFSSHTKGIEFAGVAPKSGQMLLSLFPSFPFTIDDVRNRVRRVIEEWNGKSYGEKQMGNSVRASCDMPPWKTPYQPYSIPVEGAKKAPYADAIMDVVRRGMEPVRLRPVFMHGRSTSDANLLYTGGIEIYEHAGTSSGHHIYGEEKAYIRSELQNLEVIRLIMSGMLFDRD